MKKNHLTLLGLIMFFIIFPLHMTSAYVENNDVRLALIFATTLLVTTGFLFSLFGLKDSINKYKNSGNKSEILYMFLGGLGLVVYTFVYAYFVIFSLAVLGSANTSFGLLTYAVVVIVPILIGYKTFGIKAVKDTAGGRRNGRRNGARRY